MGIKIELKGSDEIPFGRFGFGISDNPCQKAKVKTSAKW
jgi:hypothetical protein